MVQQARREAGVEVTDRIELRLGGSEQLMTAARTHEGYVAEETLATAVVYDSEDAEPAPRVDVEGESLAVEVVKASSVH